MVRTLCFTNRPEYNFNADTLIYSGWVNITCILTAFTPITSCKFQNTAVILNYSLLLLSKNVILYYSYTVNAMGMYGKK